MPQKRMKSVIPLKDQSVRQLGGKFNNGHLPPGAMTQNTWHRVYVPTYVQFVASREDAWTFNDNDAVRVMQAIWNNVYGSRIPHTVEMNDAVFSIVSLSLM